MGKISDKQDDALKKLKEIKQTPNSSFSEALSEENRQVHIKNMITTNSGRERLIALGIDPLYLAAILLQQIEEDIHNNKYPNKTQASVNNARSIQADIIKHLMQYSYNKEEIQRAIESQTFTPVIIQLPDRHYDNNEEDSVDRQQYN
jgi:hypothetical protein